MLNDQSIINLRLIGSKEYNCILKNFQVSIKKNDGNCEERKNFVGKEYNGEYQYFDIFGVGRYIRIDFIDTWGDEGNYILITEFSFIIADL